MSARDDVLGRIRTALGEPRRPPAEVVRDYRTADDRPAGDPALLDLLADRLEDYRATVLRCAPEAIGTTVAAALDAGLGTGWAAADVVVAPGVPADWRPAGTTQDDGRPAAQHHGPVVLEAVDEHVEQYRGRPVVDGAVVPGDRRHRPAVGA